MAWVSWQVGDYQSGRSKNHMSRDDTITLCRKKIPAQSREVEVFFGYEGEGECKACWKAYEKEDREYIKKTVNMTYLDSK